ncbi:MAG: AI-2E family transporter [Syntrophorhabdaceae bacterium]
MMRDDRTGALVTLLVGGACVIVIIAGIKAAAPLLSNIFLAWILANSISPFPNWLIRKRVPESLAVLSSLLIVVVGGLAVGFFFGLSVSRLIAKLPAYQASLNQVYSALKSLPLAGGIDFETIKNLDILAPARLIGYARVLLSEIGGLLGNVLLIVFLVAILLFEFVATRNGSQVRRDGKGALLARFLEASKDVKMYVAITGATGLMQAAANTIVLAVLGVDFPITWGVLFFFCNFIPAFGFLLALIPPATIAFLESGWKTALAVVVAYVILNFVGDNIIKPRFMKKGFDITILTIVLSLLFWTWVLGPIGAILAIPLTLAVKNLISRYTLGIVQDPENARDN